MRSAVPAEYLCRIRVVARGPRALRRAELVFASALVAERTSMLPLRTGICISLVERAEACVSPRTGARSRRDSLSVRIGRTFHHSQCGTSQS